MCTATLALRSRMDIRLRLVVLDSLPRPCRVLPSSCIPFVVMRNINTKDVALPPDPSWITFEDTDGDSRRWPTNTTPVVDAEGQVNYMAPLDIDHPAAIKWRIICGASIAEIMKYPDYRECSCRYSYSSSSSRGLRNQEVRAQVVARWISHVRPQQRSRGQSAS